MGKLPALLCATAIPLAAVGAPAAFADDTASHATATPSTAHRYTSKDQADAKDQVRRATETLRTMTQRDPAIESQLRNARAVFVLPRYGSGGLVVGAGGGPGVLLVRHDGKWAGPALYNVGSVSIGAQAGGQGGEVVMILKSDRAIRKLQRANAFSLDAGAGLSIVKWSRAVETGTTSPDIVVWTDLKGLYAGAAIGVTDARFDMRETSALYGRDVTRDEILQGSVHTAMADDLIGALPA